IIGLFVALKDVLSQNQKVLDAVNTITTAVSLVFNAVTTAVTNAFDAVTKTNGGFNATIEIVKSLLTIAITPLKLAFFAIKGALLGAQLAFEESFFGKGRPEKIQELREAILEVGQDIKGVIIDVVDAGKSIVENFGEAIGEVTGLVKAVVNEVKKIDLSKLKKQADTIVAGRKAALQAEVEIEKIRSRSLLNAEKERQIRDDEFVSILERIKANERLGQILEKSKTALLAQQRIIVAAAAAQAKLTGNQEDSLELQRQQNELVALEEELTGQISEQLVNKVALQKESLAISQTSIDGEIERAKVLRDFNAEQINNDAIRLQQKAIDLEIERQIELDRLQSIIDSTELGTQARADAEQNKFKTVQDFAIREIELEKQKRESKIKTLDSLIRIAGAESKLGRAVLIAKQLIATRELLIDLGAIRSKATRALAESSIEGAKSGSAVASGFAETLKLGFPAAIPALIGYAAAAVGIVGGVVSAVKGVKSTAAKFGGSGGGSVATPSLTAPSGQLSPQFNVVGASPGSQAAESISQQSNEPIEAFVVASNVTTQQQLDRDKVQTSTFG
ncbi:MAG: hypothetical protein JKY54_09315, partial [Flavobacteriales bacterium]|nr:hypothetical protein [Flavobacteriales bacterium]